MAAPNLQPVPEKPKAPAAAYAVMAGILGDAYFLTPLPKPADAVTLMVVGVDDVATQWVIRRDLGDEAMRRLRACGAIRKVHQIPNGLGPR
jgi:hypothetical protein